MTSANEDAFRAAVDLLRNASLQLEPGAGQRAWHHHLMCVASADLDPGRSGACRLLRESVGIVIALAEAGDRIAHAALCDVAADCIRNRQALPEVLGNYIVKAARKGLPGKRGRHRAEHNNRDAMICKAVYETIRTTGLPPTRNPATDDDPACAIVSRALNEIGLGLTAAAVAKIWSHRNRAYFDRRAQYAARKAAIEEEAILLKGEAGQLH